MQEPIRIPKRDTRFQPSLESREIAEYLKQMPMGAFVSYERLKEIALGKDVRKARYILYTAMKIAQADEGAVFGAVTGQGLKRLDDREIVQSGESGRKSISRKAKTLTTRIACVSYSKLNDQDRTRAITYTGLFAAVALVSAFKTIKKLSQVAESERVDVIEPSQVLKLFT